MLKIRNIARHSQQDLQRIFEIFKAAYTVEADILGVAKESFFPLTLPFEYIQESADEIVACERKGTLAGAVFVESNSESFTISNLVVDPLFFRQGIAQALVQHVLQKYSNHEIRVGTGEKNIPAIKLYEKLGFQKMDEQMVEPHLKIVKFKISARR